MAASERVYCPAKPKHALSVGGYFVIQRCVCGIRGDVVEITEGHGDVGEMAQTVAVIINDRRKDGLTVGVVRIAGSGRGVGWSARRCWNAHRCWWTCWCFNLSCDPWSSIVQHILRLHRECHRGWEALAKTSIEIEIRFEEWVETDIRAKSRPVVRVDEVAFVSMHNVHVPAHQAHLQP